MGLSGAGRRGRRGDDDRRPPDAGCRAAVGVPPQRVGAALLHRQDHSIRQDRLCVGHRPGGPIHLPPEPGLFRPRRICGPRRKISRHFQRTHPLHPEGKDAQGRAGNRLVLLGLAPRLHRADQETDRLLPDSDRRQPSPLLVGGRGGAAVRGGGGPEPGLFPTAADAGPGGPRGDSRRQPPSSGWKTAGRASWKPKSSRKRMPWPNPRKNTARSWKAPRTLSLPWIAKVASSR